MPNWCNNTGSLDGPADFIKAAYESDFDFDILRPLADGDATTLWGTKWKPDVEMQNYEINEDEGTGSISFSMQTAWAPPVALYEYLCSEKGCSVEAYYHEGGCRFCGVFENGEDHCYEYPDSADDDFWDTQHGIDIDEYFDIREDIREQEESEEESEREASEAREAEARDAAMAMAIEHAEREAREVAETAALQSQSNGAS